jgi:uncharacterized protein YqgV (UPF0045/DUF77 family)
MNTISVQVSLYPLGQASLGPAISKAMEAFRMRGLDVRPGIMSTLVVGETDAIFDGLKASFQSASALGDIVMVASISNCCPVPTDDQRNAEHSA